MPTTTRLVEVLPSRLAGIAARVEARRRELRLTQQRLAQRCTEIWQQLFPADCTDPVPCMTRGRMAKILMARSPRAAASAAKALYPHELEILAQALEVSVDWLAGPDPHRTVIVWDPLTEPHRAQHVLHLIAQYRDQARNLRSWATFLPCSFETPAVMHAHHRAIFSSPGVGDTDEAVNAVVRLYDAIGNANRKRTLRNRRTRSWRFTHCMLLSDLTAVATGSGGYRLCTAAMRRTCFERLIQLLRDDTYKMRLVVAADSDVANIRRQFLSFDSLFISDAAHAMWRDHAGNLLWSVHPRVVDVKLDLLRALEARASYSRRTDVLALLQQLLRSIDAGRRAADLALKELALTLSSTGALPPQQRTELLDLVSRLGRQATLPAAQRSRRVVKAATARLLLLTSATASLAPFWVTWGPAITTFFGIDR